MTLLLRYDIPDMTKNMSEVVPVAWRNGEQYYNYLLLGAIQLNVPSEALNLIIY